MSARFGQSCVAGALGSLAGSSAPAVDLRVSIRGVADGRTSSSQLAPFSPIGGSPFPCVERIGSSSSENVRSPLPFGRSSVSVHRLASADHRHDLVVLDQPALGWSPSNSACAMASSRSRLRSAAESGR